ncbi:MAG: hypothetical protein AB7K86_12815 [Rhodospirillales bacterium]
MTKLAAAAARWCAAAMIAVALCGPAAADEAVRRELQSVLDRYYEAGRKGDIDSAMALNPAMRAMYDEAIKDKRPRAEVRKRMGAMLKATAPVSYEVLHFALGKDGDAAVLIVSGKPAPGADMQGMSLAEVEYAFNRANGRWTIGPPLFHPDPATIKRPPEDAFEPEENYTENRQTSLGGRIRGVRLADDHTMIVIRVLDEDQLAYLPPAAKLREAGFEPDGLRLFRIVSVEGIRHPSKDYKVWVTGLELLD